MYPTVKLPTFGTVVKRVKSSSSNPSPGIIQRKVYEFFVTILNANRLSFNLIKKTHLNIVVDARGNDLFGGIVEGDGGHLVRII